MCRFLLVSLNVDAILQETTISRRRQKLGAITDGLGLGGAYSETLSRIKGQGGEKSRLGMAALMWISHAERPLKVDELCHALGVEIGSPDLDSDNVPSIRTLLSCCQGLVTVQKEASAVRLIHFTLQEYLRAHPRLFSTTHSTMAETCLSYLNSHQIKSLPGSHHYDIWGAPVPRDPFLVSGSASLGHFSRHSGTRFQGYSSLHSGLTSLGYSSQISNTPLLGSSPLFSSMHSLERSPLHSSRPLLKDSFGVSGMPSWRRPPPHSITTLLEDCPLESGTPFLEYSSLYWGVHAKRDLSDCAKQLALRLFDCYNNHISAKILFGTEKPHPPSSSHQHSQFSGLHCASFFGIAEIVDGFVEVEGCDISQKDCTGSTPLMWAARNGHEGAVKVLLGRDDVDPNEPTEDGQTPLWCASKNGHEGVVRMLLGRDAVNPDKASGSGETPL